MPARHLSRLIHVQVAHQSTCDVDRYDCDEEVGAIGCQSLHVLELPRAVLDEVDEVEEGEETASSEVRAGVLATEADLLPVAGLAPPSSKVGLVDGEVVQFVQSRLMVCIVTFVVVRKLSLYLLVALDLDCGQTVGDRAAHAADAQLVPRPTLAAVKSRLVHSDGVAKVQPAGRWRRSQAAVVGSATRGWVQLELVLSDHRRHVHCQRAINIVIIRPDEGVGPYSLVPVLEIDW